MQIFSFPRRAILLHTHKPLGLYILPRLLGEGRAEGGGREEPRSAGRLGREGNAPSRWVGSAICGSGE